MIISKLTSMGRTTIPQPDRTALGVAEGDELTYTIDDGCVILTKAPPRRVRCGDPVEDPLATSWEWDSKADQEDFADL